MKTSQKLKVAAHRAIVQYITDHLLEVEYVQVNDRLVVNKSEFATRRQVLGLLKKYGYPQYIIENDSEEFYPEPSFFVRKQCEKEGSWTQYLIYNVDEVQEFINHIQSEDSPLEMLKEAFEGGAYYGGPGRPFRDNTVVYQKRKRIIVESSGGIDW